MGVQELDGSPVAERGPGAGRGSRGRAARLGLEEVPGGRSPGSGGGPELGEVSVWVGVRGPGRGFRAK